MSSEWSKRALGQMADVFTGFSFKGEGYLPPGTGIRVVRGDNVTEHSVRWGAKEKCWPTITDELRPFLLRTGDVVIGMDGSKVGKNFAAITPADDGTLLAQRVARVRAREGVNQDFIRYLVCNLEFTDYVQSVHTGTSIPHISKGQIQRFEVYVPPLQDQNWIASLLKALDDRITLLRETNATLEAIAKALFKSWFVDFDPVRAKMEGRAPEDMDEAAAALFPDGFEESALGLVPKGWRVGALGDIAQTVRKQLQPAELHAELHHVGLEHIPRQSLSLSSWGTADGLESAKAAFSEGDILFGKLRPYFHKVVVAPFDGVCSTDVLVCQGACPEYYGVAAMHLFSTALIDYADRLSNGAKMPRVNWKDLAAYPIVIPPKRIAAEYAQAIEPMLARMKSNVHEAQTLATLRDTLLPRLISGALRLDEAKSDNTNKP